MNFGTFCFQIWSFWFPDCMFSISWWNFLISWFLNNFWFPDSWIYISWLNFIFPDFLDWISYFLISQFSVSWLNVHFPDFLIYFPFSWFPDLFSNPNVLKLQAAMNLRCFHLACWSMLSFQFQFFWTFSVCAQVSNGKGFLSQWMLLKLRQKQLMQLNLLSLRVKVRKLLKLLRMRIAKKNLQLKWRLKQKAKRRLKWAWSGQLQQQLSRLPKDQKMTRS